MKRAVLDGVDCGPKYEVQFTPNDAVFRITRKLVRQKVDSRFHRFRAISDVREVPSVPVRCIEVSAPSGQFLVTRSYIPTHNSSLGRLGLLIHSTAGFIDPGWDGHVTLELSNVANLPITIYHGMKIGQISFMQLTEPTSTPYGTASLGSKYQGQRGPTPSPLLAELRVVKILVTGGTGFVGPAIVHALRAENRDVRALVRRPDRASHLTSLGVELAHGRRHRPGEPEGGRRGMHPRRAPGRDHQGRPDDFQRVMTVGTARTSSRQRRPQASSGSC